MARLGQGTQLLTGNMRPLARQNWDFLNRDYPNVEHVNLKATTSIKIKGGSILRPGRNGYGGHVFNLGLDLGINIQFLIFAL